MNQPSPIIHVRGVNKSYGNLHVLRDLSLDVLQVKRWPSLAQAARGKSTLLRMLMTLEQPDSGEIEVDGLAMWSTLTNGQRRPADEPHLRDVRKKLGMVFQHFNLFPHMTVPAKHHKSTTIGAGYG